MQYNKQKPFFSAFSALIFILPVASFAGEEHDRSRMNDDGIERNKNGFPITSTGAIMQEVAEGWTENQTKELAEFRSELREKHVLCFDALYGAAKHYFEKNRTHEIMSEDRGTIDRVNWVGDVGCRIANLLLFLKWMIFSVITKPWYETWDIIGPNLYHPTYKTSHSGCITEIAPEHLHHAEREVAALEKKLSELIQDLLEKIAKNPDIFPQTKYYIENSKSMQNIWNAYADAYCTFLYQIAEDYDLSSEGGQNCSANEQDIRNNRAILKQQWRAFLLTERIRDLEKFKKEIESRIESYRDSSKG